MISVKTLSSAAFVAAVTVAGYASDAAAHRTGYRHGHGSYCVARMEGRATGQGILGLGTANARVFARNDWESRVADRWGSRYADLGRARAVRWDCKKGAILQAKCVVTAIPCR